MTPPREISALKLLAGAAYIVALPALMLLLAGDLHWVEGWVFAVWFAGLCATVMIWLYRKDPALLAERFRRPGSGGQRPWDRAWVHLMQLGFLAWVAIIPLDARRFSWTPSLALWVKAAGAGLLLASSFMLFRAFRDNTYLSPLVRIQKERKQRVISTGVYGVVRHPMYLGALLLFAGAPLLLGSFVGLAIGMVLTLLLVARIFREEDLLKKELDGYMDYCRNVRYRLLPFIW